MTGAGYLAFLPLLAGFAGAAAFLGLPLPGTLRTFSKSLSVYKASFETGLKPNSNIRCLAVFVEIPILAAISFTVKNSLPFISIYYFIGKYVKKYTLKVEKSIQLFSNLCKKIKKLYRLGIFYIDKNIHSGYIISIS
jgi:hypothetical protein